MLRHAAEVKSDLTDTLCTECALCCDGSLFADVELAGRAEAAHMEMLGIEVDEDGSRGGVMTLPCVALHGRRCSIYAHRPGTCRTFECQLLLDVRHGDITVESALEHISTTRSRIADVLSLLERLSPSERSGVDESLPLRERCDEALMPASTRDAGSLARRAALEVAMQDLEHRIDSRFRFRAG